MNQRAGADIGIASGRRCQSARCVQVSVCWRNGGVLLGAGRIHANSRARAFLPAVSPAMARAAVVSCDSDDPVSEAPPAERNAVLPMSACPQPPHAPASSSRRGADRTERCHDLRGAVVTRPPTPRHDDSPLRGSSRSRRSRIRGAAASALPDGAHPACVRSPLERDRSGGVRIDIRAHADACRSAASRRPTPRRRLRRCGGAPLSDMTCTALAHRPTRPSTAPSTACGTLACDRAAVSVT